MDFSLWIDSFQAQPPARKAGTILAVLLLAVGVGGTLSLKLGKQMTRNMFFLSQELGMGQSWVKDRWLIHVNTH